MIKQWNEWTRGGFSNWFLLKHTGWKGHFKVDIDPHPLLIILMMWKNRKSVNLHKRAKMVTSETAVLYIGYKHEEFIDILFLKSKKKKKKSLLLSSIIENLP